MVQVNHGKSHDQKVLPTLQTIPHYCFRIGHSTFQQIIPAPPLVDIPAIRHGIEEAPTKTSGKGFCYWNHIPPPFNPT